jgi:hypothetical protein
MTKSTKMNGLPGISPADSKKDWKKPVMDIFELERAEAGIGRKSDSHFTHVSA